eukprot:m.24760 g.24760  ORF g.24760 m.24760 type:complete len:260 (+) comp8760_c0_seq1:1965-2744(+)
MLKVAVGLHYTINNMAAQEEEYEEPQEEEQPEEAPAAAEEIDESDPRAAMKKRLAALKAARSGARQANHEQVVEEDRRAKLPKNFESKKRRAEWVLENEEKKKEAEEKGEDFARIKALQMTAEESDARARMAKKTNPDTGFADYQQAQFRQYQRLTKTLKPDVEAYHRSVEKWGDDFTANSLSYAEHGRVSKDGVDRMVEDLKGQIEKRAKFSRHRAEHADSEIDSINDRNKRFNKKAERFYGAHTKEIKEALERGSAV